jgi:hypothetical protein
MKAIVVTDQAAGTAGVKLVEDKHRQSDYPRRCRRRLQPDRATQGQDDHPRSSLSDTRHLTGAPFSLMGGRFSSYGVHPQRRRGG